MADRSSDCRAGCSIIVRAVRRRCLTLIGLILGASLCTGGLDLLQLVAWTGMVVTRCQQESLSTSITTTFDGRHPCALCTMIAKQRQQNPDRLLAVMQLLQHLAKVAVVPQHLHLHLVVVCLRDAGEWPDRTGWYQREHGAPPTPPPEA